jgi:predicted Rossmann-fold nucleotide-binding protein
MKKEAIVDLIYKDHFRVAIFGSARTKENSNDNKSIYQLGKLFGERELI